MLAIVGAITSLFTLVGSIFAAIKSWRGFVKEQREDRERARREAEEARNMQAKADAEWRNSVDNRMDKLYDSQQAFGHDRIVAECNRHLHNHYITTVDLDNMMHLMRAYEGVGGNGTAHMLWEKVKQLPIDDSKEPDAIRGEYDAQTRQEIKEFMEVKTA
ncbi:hypothetical protein [Lacticaseibacillus sharpeae]|uniref:Uncharacterized protein n=1 Tax=Lacticaseibacillus sharpeae JCM 1186 = DSM 20505 TaxID=1291052 RepID=A0A0R1ZVI6_9LACO|nr:hypothetical protein [Lacticaseibacillus sharpeae]KRM54828.1 hypothetical protein FC18_GL002245 [Lacticaseibacillus sharpeae JCM 1186 = DSM 20505]